MLFSALQACFEHLSCCFWSWSTRRAHPKGKNSAASGELTGMSSEQGRSSVLTHSQTPAGRQDPQHPWSSSPHVLGQAGIELVYDGDDARLGTGGTVPHTLSSCLGQALVINYCHFILNRGGLLESPVNQAWNYHCGFAISLSPAEQLLQLLLEIPILKALLQLPHEGSWICSCTPGHSTARQAGRGSFPLMTAICRFL